MLKKLLLVAAWFPLASILLVLLVTNLNILTQDSKNASERRPKRVTFADLNSPGYKIAAPGSSAQVLSATVVAADARSLLLKQFLSQFDSPLAEHTEVIVQEADEHELDYRLTTAIAGCESTFGKHIPSSQSFNAHGISVYTGETSGATFLDWPQEIAWVSRYVKEEYIDQGLTDLVSMGAKWAPPSVEKGNSWANCVTHFLDQIQ